MGEMTESWRVSAPLSTKLTYVTADWNRSATRTAAMATRAGVSARIMDASASIPRRQKTDNTATSTSEYRHCARMSCLSAAYASHALTRISAEMSGQARTILARAADQPPSQPNNPTIGVINTNVLAGQNATT